MLVLVRGINSNTGMFVSCLNNHKPDDAGKQHAVLHKERAVGFASPTLHLFFMPLFFP